MRYRMLCGDARELVATLNESVHMVITSPPYYDKISYGAAGEIGHELADDTPRPWVVAGVDAEHFYLYEWLLGDKPFVASPAPLPDKSMFRLMCRWGAESHSPAP
jgi:DNA modification methylase